MMVISHNSPQSDTIVQVISMMMIRICTCNHTWIVRKIYCLCYIPSQREQPVNTAHQSLRNYIRRQHEQERERPLDEFTTQVPEMSTEESPELPSASSDNEIFSLALQRHRSTQPETRRRHSRRNLQDLDTIHQSMSGEN